MKNKTIKNKRNIKNRNKKKNKTKHVRFAKKLEHYHKEGYNPIKIPTTSRCTEPAIEIKSALVSNVLHTK